MIYLDTSVVLAQVLAKDRQPDETLWAETLDRRREGRQISPRLRPGYEPMRMLHDPAVRTSIEDRLNTLRPDSPRQWGTLTADQMLWHANQLLESSLGEGTLPAEKLPLPAPLMRFMLLYLPWPKSAPTNRGAVPTGEHDFEAERARCRALIDRFVSRPLNGAWPVDPSFGKVNGKFNSKLHAKHLDHHFRQFSA